MNRCGGFVAFSGQCDKVLRFSGHEVHDFCRIDPDMRVVKKSLTEQECLRGDMTGREDARSVMMLHFSPRENAQAKSLNLPPPKRFSDSRTANSQNIVLGSRSICLKVVSVVKNSKAKTPTNPLSKLLRQLQKSYSLWNGFASAELALRILRLECFEFPGLGPCISMERAWAAPSTSTSIYLMVGVSNTNIKNHMASRLTNA